MVTINKSEEEKTNYENLYRDRIQESKMLAIKCRNLASENEFAKIKIVRLQGKITKLKEEKNHTKKVISLLISIVLEKSIGENNLKKMQELNILKYMED